MNFSLGELGWNEDFENSFNQYEDKYKVGRVAVEHKNMYKVLTEAGEVLGTVSGKMSYEALDREDYPAVGDWVVIDRISSQGGNAIIHSILPRKSKFSRKIAGNQSEEQIIAVNVDTVFICMSLNNNFNLRRLERYLIAAWDSGATPVVLLTKADLCDEIEERIEEVQSVAFGVPTHVLSSVEGTGIESLNQYIKKGETLAFLGSSGVGKSTLINYLLGEEKLVTQEIRSTDHRGKHTTTHRELIVLPDGGLVIDTPGMREFHITDTEEGLSSTFNDIEELAAKCKFNDCKHKKEPGCAIQDAIDNGVLTTERFSNYLKLQREAQYMARKEEELRRKRLKQSSIKSKSYNRAK